MGAVRDVREWTRRDAGQSVERLVAGLGHCTFLADSGAPISTIHRTNEKTLAMKPSRKVGRTSYGRSHGRCSVGCAPPVEGQRLWKTASNEVNHLAVAARLRVDQSITAAVLPVAGYRTASNPIAPHHVRASPGPARGHPRLPPPLPYITSGFPRRTNLPFLPSSLCLFGLDPDAVVRRVRLISDNASYNGSS